VHRLIEQSIQSRQVVSLHQKLEQANLELERLASELAGYKAQ
jgi:hypothetical protein